MHSFINIRMRETCVQLTSRSEPTVQRHQSDNESHNRQRLYNTYWVFGVGPTYYSIMTCCVCACPRENFFDSTVCNHAVWNGRVGGWETLIMVAWKHINVCARRPYVHIEHHRRTQTRTHTNVHMYACTYHWHAGRTDTYTCSYTRTQAHRQHTYKRRASRMFPASTRVMRSQQLTLIEYPIVRTNVHFRSEFTISWFYQQWEQCNDHSVSNCRN